MDDILTIRVGHLRDGQVIKIDETVASTFLDVEEEELSFGPCVKVEGEAYLVDENLVLRLLAEATATLPCAVCNEKVDVTLRTDGGCHAIPLDEVKGGIYDYSELLREDVLLEVPSFVECCEGRCPHRELMRRHLKGPAAPFCEGGASSVEGLD